MKFWLTEAFYLIFIICHIRNRASITATEKAYKELFLKDKVDNREATCYKIVLG